jgi:hypothetical protein
MRRRTTERRETMNNSRYFDPAERSAFMRCFTATGAQRVLAGGSIGLRVGGPALGCRRGSRPPWKSAVADPAADAQIPWSSLPWRVNVTSCRCWGRSLIGSRMSKRPMATPSSVKGVGATFTLSQCRRSRGHQSSKSMCASHQADDSTSLFPSAHRCPTSKRSPLNILCTGLILHESRLCR